MQAQPQRIRRPRRRTNVRPRSNRAGSLLSLAAAPSTRSNPDAEYIFNRRALDLTCYLDSTGAFNVGLPPGSGSVTTALLFGTPAPDISPSTSYVPWFLELTLGGLAGANRLLQFFSEFQIRAARVEFQSLMGDSYSPSIAQNGGVIPEVVSAVYPLANSQPPSFDVMLAMPDVKRSTLTLARPHTNRCRPRPVLTSPSGQLYVLDDVRSPWFSGDQAYNGMWGFVRNLPQVPIGGQPFTFRVVVEVQLACRRPY